MRPTCVPHDPIALLEEEATSGGDSGTEARAPDEKACPPPAARK
jgi:hypothetical protein